MTSYFEKNHNEPSCPEPDGNRIVILGNREVAQHDEMLRLTGQCPWCGEEEPPLNDIKHRRLAEQQERFLAECDEPRCQEYHREKIKWHRSQDDLTP